MHLGRVHISVTVVFLTVAAFLLSTGSVDAQVVFAGTGTGPIPDTTPGCGTNSPPGAPLVVSFAVSGVTEDLGRVAVEMDIAHTWSSDLTVELAAPGAGPSSPVFGRILADTPTDCGDSSDLGAVYGFADGNQYFDLWTAAVIPGNDEIIPSEVYFASAFGEGTGGGAEVRFTNAFNGMTPPEVNGTWTLTFIDNSGGDIGDVFAADLHIFESSIFADGFESGDTIVWSSTVP